MSSKPRFVGKRVKLGDVCTIVSGATPKTKTNEYWGGEIRWVTPAELDGDSHYISDTEKHLTEAGYKSASLRMMPKGTVLLTTRAPIGKVAIAAEEMSCNQGFKNLVCSSAINNEFLYLYLKSRTAELQAMGRGATFKELSKKNVAGFEINLPAIDRQLDAVAKLTAVRSQIALAKQQHDQLDSLVKSRFVEMFSGVDQTRPLEKLIVPKTRISYGIVQPGPEGTGDMGILRPVDIVDGRLCLKGIKRIDRKIGDSYRRTELTGNEILTVVRGATGQTVRSEANCIGMNVTRGIAVIRYDPSLIDPDYLVSYMNSDDGQRYIADHTQGATLQQINIADLKAMPIPAPSLKSQQRFAAFAAQVDKSRFIAQQQIEKLQMLYNSLAQDYFGD